MSEVELAATLVTGCPGWCQANHGSQIHPDDRWHDAAALPVPGVRRTLRRNAEGTLRADLTGADFVVTARQSMDGSETWVFIGDEQGLESSLETASRISRGLVRLLDEILGVTDGRS